MFTQAECLFTEQVMNLVPYRRGFVVALQDFFLFSEPAGSDREVKRGVLIIQAIL